MAATTLLTPPTMAARASSSSRRLSFTDTSSMLSTKVVPKGFLAVCVGKELKRFIIPIEYLGHQAVGVLLREAEEEFGFQQEGVLKIPCEVAVFVRILKVEEEKRDVFFLHEFGLNAESHPQIVSSHLLTILKCVGDQKMRRSDQIRFPQIVACPPQLVI